MIPIYLMQDNQPFRLDYLVIAGGGGGGYLDSDGGGGGAGGYLCSVTGELSGGSSSPTERVIYNGGETITVQIGAGGASNSKGSNSILGDLVALGGGKGQANASDSTNIDGGSGGGANSSGTAGLAETNQGSNGGAGGGGGANYPGSYMAGGGGGAGEAGNTDGQSTGGDGLTSSITGTAITRAGGGAGARGNFSGGQAAGGDGGGGTGAVSNYQTAFDPISATSAPANTGSGGGGGFYYVVPGVGDYQLPAGSGGSGFIAIRYPSLARIIDYIDPGLTYTYSDDGTWKRYIFTAGTGSIRF